MRTVFRVNLIENRHNAPVVPANHDYFCYYVFLLLRNCFVHRNCKILFHQNTKEPLRLYEGMGPIFDLLIPRISFVPCANLNVDHNRKCFYKNFVYFEQICVIFLR